MFMFHFLDEDTDMYNTPYTYNAGRTALLAGDDQSHSAVGKSPSPSSYHPHPMLSVPVVKRRPCFLSQSMPNKRLILSPGNEN